MSLSHNKSKKGRVFTEGYNSVQRGLAPEFQRVYSNLPLVINLPGDMMVAFGSGLEAARSGVPDCMCPPDWCPEHRAMWFDGYRVGLTRVGDVTIRQSDLEWEY